MQRRWPSLFGLEAPGGRQHWRARRHDHGSRPAGRNPSARLFSTIYILYRWKVVSVWMRVRHREDTQSQPRTRLSVGCRISTGGRRRRPRQRTTSSTPWTRAPSGRPRKPRAPRRTRRPAPSGPPAPTTCTWRSGCPRCASPGCVRRAADSAAHQRPALFSRRLSNKLTPACDLAL